MGRKWTSFGNIVFWNCYSLVSSTIKYIPLRLQGPIKTAPVGLLADPLSIWQAERIDEGHEDQR